MIEGYHASEIPAVGWVILALILVFFAWRTARAPKGARFRWIGITGYCVALAGIVTGLLWIVPVGGLAAVVGLRLDTYFGWTGRDVLKKADRKKRPMKLPK
ncbi:hypothetical protein [Streptomyces sp. NBC_00503]|uniref:hypothetical protein n=1 Tax=Streptomyces sp. NBC_00503 TaxID=2903659 RepID=UPI002E8073D3|nr:hypothetical protein [Streptomyces sp. NBC_00503]WUD80047.1 hypothetical protein OG490_05425 [Streptomyces sp. NBC_00503]